MSQEVPLTAADAQTLSINLGGQACQIALNTYGLGDDAHLYFSLTVGITPIVTSRVCRNLQNILSDAEYRGFQGGFMFVDNQGDINTGQDPQGDGLGSRYELLYLTAAEIAASVLL
jgi:hypothetical protein